ncbi:MAG: helix-turn-helix transcriptional regulator [Verrucomicrobiota bacterium]
MSYFSTALRAIIEKSGESRATFAAKVGIPTSNLHQYVHGRTRPDVVLLEKICSSLSEEECVALVVAHLHDETPKSIEPLVRIISLVKSPSVVKEEPPAYMPELPASIRDSLEFLGRLAVQHPETGKWLAGTAKMLRSR